MKSSTRLKAILASRSAAVLPGTPNALEAVGKPHYDALEQRYR